MKTILSIFVVVFALVACCFAQQSNETGAAKSDGQVILKAGTEISAELQNKVDVAGVKRGDDFNLKLIDDVKGETKTISRGDELIGRVSNARKSGDEDKSSEIRVFFDFLKVGGDYLPIKASIVSVKQDGKAADLQFSASTVFAGATIITKKEGNLQLNKGDVVQIKLDEDLKSSNN